MKMRTVLLVFLLPIILVTRDVQAFKGRDAIHLGSSVVNLFFLGLVGWQSGHEEPMFPDPEGGFIPNDNLSPDSAEAILLQKISDQMLELPYLRGIRTLPRHSLEDFLKQAEEKRSEKENVPSFIDEALTYLRDEEARRRQGWGSPYLDPAFQASYSFSSSPERAVPDVTGMVNPLLDSHEGMFSEEGHNGWVGGRLRGGLTPWLSYEAAPRALFSSKGSAFQEQARFYLHRGYLKANIRSFEIELGKDTVQWGQGHSGSLLFSGNAEPFYLLRLANSRPVRLPWFFRRLGPTRLDFFFTFLDGNRRFPHSILHGMKTSFKPHPRLELGFGQSLQFGGEGSGSWNPLNYFSEALLSQNGNGNVDHNFILEARYRIPKLEIEPYVELFWEDCCRNHIKIVNPRDMLNLAGIYFPNLGFGGKVDFAAEWVRTNRITYRHGLYTSGLFYRGHGIGHPLGPDGTAIYGILRYFHSPVLWGKLTTGFEQRGRQDGASPEDRYQFVVQVYHQVSSHIRIRWEGGYERVSRFNFQNGVNRDNVVAGVTLELFSGSLGSKK